MSYEIKRKRSKFYLKIHENEDSFMLSANRITMRIISANFNELKWNPSSNYNDLYNSKVTLSSVGNDYLPTIIDYAEKANSRIWLIPNQNTQTFFSGNELDFCVACDWNFDFNSRRHTKLGNAEYSLKYLFPKREISEDDRSKFSTQISNALLDTVPFIPTANHNCIIMTIPSTLEGKFKLAYFAAKHIADRLGLDFIDPALTTQKPEMKILPVSDKISKWREIYSGNDIMIPGDVAGRDILIIDDLYQSGALVWCYGEYLKQLGASTVSAISIVKSLRDSDNNG